MKQSFQVCRNSQNKSHRNYSVRPTSSMAEENQVRNFRLFSQTQGCSITTNQPQRIELPCFFNTPARFKNMNKNKIQLSEKQNDPKSLQTPELCIYLQAQRRLKDYEMLAFACKRAGKIKDEGRAYYSMGVLLDNMGKWSQAIQQYERFLQICTKIDDQHGCGLAYNCIGADYQLMAESNPKFIEKAIEFHKKHEEISDSNGKFLASINLGLCYDANTQLSMFYFQQALKHAMNMSSKLGQTIAIANIGRIGQKGLYDNAEKMKLFIEKFLLLANELKDTESIIKGHMKLGAVSAQMGSYNEGKNSFLKALEMVENDRYLYQEAKCGFAISNAEMNMEQYLREQAQLLKQ
ncbi:unnamed protein product [Paramecium primaurelia]|uniref:Tetratricopeptide repeat protein n=1 Tax=Paramecium primaurelia TaxID=5886 RepID=A0A8S1KDT2_PARPR|nr:unnamed protein product [Paramecium primaurelia]